MNTSGMSLGGERRKPVIGREMFVSRILGAIFWNIAFQCVVVCCTIFVMNMDIMHPKQWFAKTTSAIMTIASWLHFLPVAVITFGQGVLVSRDYIMGTTCSRTRFGILCSVFQGQNIVITVMNTLLGAMVVLYYSSIVGEGTIVLTKTCTVNVGKCLNERSMFLLFNGMWVGLYSSLKRIVWETHSLLFPLIQQYKYPQVKNHILRLAYQSVKEAVPPTLYFLFLYAWFGGYLREHLSGFLGVLIDEEPAKSYFGWMHMSLNLCALLFSSITILIGRTTEMFLQVFLTEHHYFPVANTLDKQLVLSEALGSRSLLLHQLGCLELLFIAELDPKRRRELYSLSVPGGHPHNWNAVVNELLKALSSFTSELNLAICDVNRAANGPLFSASPSKVTQPVAYNIMPSSPRSTSFLSATQTSPQGIRLRNMSHLHSLDVSDSFVISSPRLTKSSTDEKGAFEVVKHQVCNLLEWVRRKPGINLLFGELEEAQARHLLIHSQHIAWASQALAHLAAASLTKDIYGIVQKDIPSILRALVNLKGALDRLPLYSHKRALRLDSLDIRMKASLTSAVKRSLYIICGTFGHYLSELPISDEIRQHLAGFVSYKEG